MPEISHSAKSVPRTDDTHPPSLCPSSMDLSTKARLSLAPAKGLGLNLSHMILPAPVSATLRTKARKDSSESLTPGTMGAAITYVSTPSCDSLLRESSLL